jgi:hypothetical protein
VDSTEIGADFFQNGKLDVSMIDSATVKLSTVMMEDITSNGKDRLIVGSYPDAQLGRISATAFLQFQISAAVTLPTSDIEYESFQLVLKNDGYSFYDTTTMFSFDVHKLSELAEHDDDGNLYTSDVLAYDDVRVATAQFYPRPNRSTEYEIPLSDVLGKIFYDKAQQSDNDLTDNTEFTSFFNGLALVPDENTATSLLGLASEISLRLYYYDKSVVPSIEKYISFSLNTTSSFTHFKAYREGTALAGLTEPSEKLSADDTDNASYIQGGTSLALRIDMPYLRDFTQHANFYLTRAVLEFSPVHKSYDGMRPLVERLVAYRVDGTNEIYNTSPFTAGLVTDYSLSRDTYYEVDVTSFVREQMDMVSLNENGLVFIFNETEINANRLYVSGQSDSYATKLKIYYATINE